MNQVKNMEDESYQALNDNTPFVAWIHNISLNQQKYMKSKFNELDLGHDVRYIMFIYDNPSCSGIQKNIKGLGNGSGNNRRRH